MFGLKCSFLLVFRRDTKFDKIYVISQTQKLRVVKLCKVSQYADEISASTSQKKTKRILQVRENSAKNDEILT